MLRFNDHGYRFIEITGIDKVLLLEDVKGVVLSSIDGLAHPGDMTSNDNANQCVHRVMHLVSILYHCTERKRVQVDGDRYIGSLALLPMCRSSASLFVCHEGRTA